MNVIAAPTPTYSFLLYNLNLFSSTTLTKTLSGKRSVTIPAWFVVDPIETGVAPTPTKLEPGV